MIVLMHKEIFNDTKYTRWYTSIVDGARRANRVKNQGVYLENHHIIPRAIKKSKRTEGTVLLTAREHLICHLLLAKMCVSLKHRHAMICALHGMLKISPNQQRDRTVTSRTLSRFRETYASVVSQRLKGVKKPSGFGAKISAALRGVRKTEKHKIALSENHHDVAGHRNPMYGKKVSDAAKEKISSGRDKRIGSMNGMFGKTHTPEARCSISQSSRSRWSPEARDKTLAKTRRSRLLNRLIRAGFQTTLLALDTPRLG